MRFSQRREQVSLRHGPHRQRGNIKSDGLVRADIPKPPAALTMAAEALDQLISTGLSGQQLRVLILLSEGHSNKAIAWGLDITEATVKAHIGSVLRALGCSNRTQAVLAGLRFRLESAEPTTHCSTDNRQVRVPPSRLRAQSARGQP